MFAPTKRLNREIEIRVGGASQRVPAGTPPMRLLPARVDGALVIAALVDRKATGLSSPLMASADLEPLTTATPDGQRYHRNSQGLLLLEAAYRVDPRLSLRLSHSLGFAQRVELLTPPSEPLETLVPKIEAAMNALAAEDAPLRSEWITVAEARELFEGRGWRDAVALVTFWKTPLVDLATYGEFFVPSPGPLAPSAGLAAGARLTIYGQGLLLVFANERQESRPPPAPTKRLTGRHAAVLAATQTEPTALDQERWLSAVGIGSVGEFNAACVGGEVSPIIRVSEGFQEKRICAIADAIADAGDTLKIVAVAGPSSSGKTTFIKRLKVQLQVNGLRPVGLSLDDYYCDRDATPRDARGQLDYEAFEALRHDLLGEHLVRLVKGESVRTASYDFHTGKSDPAGGPPIRLAHRDILMVEGIHGLNPFLLGQVGNQSSYRIFVCPLTQLPFDRLSRVHVSDVRLLRRIIRDRHDRGTSPADNIMRWPSVRAGELAHIFPYQGNADAVFDSSLVYELAVLKVYAERYLLEVPYTHPAHTTAYRLLELVERFVAIYPDHVPPTSLLREFIGGSTFER